MRRQQSTPPSLVKRGAIHRGRGQLHRILLLAVMATLVPLSGLSIQPSVNATTIFPVVVDIDTFRSDDSEIVAQGPVLESGQPYSITVQGTFSVWPLDEWSDGTCEGTSEPTPIFSSGGTTNGPVGRDAEYGFAAPEGTSNCSEAHPDHTSRFEMSLDGGATFAHIHAENEGAAPDPGHTYQYAVTGQGNPIAFRVEDEPRDDNYGVLRATIEEATIEEAACTALVVPGVAGTYAADVNNDLGWLLNRGVAPNQLQIDPLGRVYDDLIRTLENTGYVQGEDLFVANYDWRLPPGPIDGTIDGTIQGISGASITDTTYQYSVDYLGHFLREAVEAHEADDPDARLECVDVIAHSTGGLVARSYIQSPAYQDTFMSDNGERTLPRVNEFIMIGVPNRGASKAWNPLHDNWVVDTAYRAVLSKIVDRAYQKVLQGATIPGPDHTISLASIDDGTGTPDPERFIQQYAPTMKSLLATYDFIDFGSGFTDVNSDPQWRNSLILDLNDGLDLQPTADPSPFADRSTVTVIYAGNQVTATSVVEHVGAAGGANALLPFSDYAASDAQAGDIWYDDIEALASGDGTVPLDSAIGQFVGDGRVTLRSFSATHTGLVGDVAVQTTILETLGVSFEAGDITSGTGTAYTTALWVTLDPVEGYVVDGLGRRLGYTTATGALTEIPGSVWFGTTDGFGLVTDIPVVEPLTLELIGLGEDHYVMVAVEQNGESGGVISQGFLEDGEQVSAPIPLGEPANASPTVTTDQATVTVAEGQTALMSGSYANADGDAVTLTASAGTLTKTGTSSGAWNWSLATTDGPAQSQTVTINADNGNGGTAETTFDLVVTNVAPTVSAIAAPTDPVALTSEITASALFTDAGTLDTHTAVFDWGDSTASAGAVSEANGSGSVTGSHTYTAAGVYTVTLTVTDDDFGAGQSSYQYVVVYDPDGGFVTGGGWITSPEGAHVADPTLTGKASFSFVAKYKKGQTVPDGKTQFQFQAAGLSFHLTSYDWLVIAGAQAKFKGTGTIDGRGGYGFMLTAVDGQLNGGGSDTFRIKIWDIATDAIVYDNQLGDADDAAASDGIEGGLIVIHK